MQIEAHHEIDLTEALDDEIAALLEAAFGKDDGYEGRSFYKQRNHLRLVARDNGQLVGHIGVVFRVIRLGDRLAPILGLADVATAPDREGQGVASALLHETEKFAKDTQAAFILLFGDHPIYEKRGFMPVKNTLRFLRIEDSRSEEIVTMPTKSLHIMAVADLPWDDKAEVDLLGYIF